MANKLYKVTCIYHLGVMGWSESYYWTRDSGTIDQCFTDADNLNLQRLALNGVDTICDGIRITDISPDRAVKSSRIFWNAELASSQTVTSKYPKSTDPWSCAIMRAYTADKTGSRTITLRALAPALWGYVTTMQASEPPPSAWLSLIQGYQQELVGAPGKAARPWCLRQRVAPSISGTFNLSSATIVQPGGYFSVVGAFGTNLPLGTRVHVSGAKGPGTKGLNGDSYVIGNTTSTTAELSAFQKCPSGSVQFTRIPVLTPIVYGYPALSSLQLVRYAIRKTGRAFVPTRGRQPAVKC